MRRTGYEMTTTTIKVHIPKAMVLWMQRRSKITQAEAVELIKMHAHRLDQASDLVYFPDTDSFDVFEVSQSGYDEHEIEVYEGPLIGIRY